MKSINKKAPIKAPDTAGILLTRERKIQDSEQEYFTLWVR